MPKSGKSSPSVASTAGKVLQDPNASALQKSLAASVIAQSRTGKETSPEMATKAAEALQDGRVNDTTLTLAGSVLSQKP